MMVSIANVKIMRFWFGILLKFCGVCKYNGCCQHSPSTLIIYKIICKCNRNRCLTPELSRDSINNVQFNVHGDLNKKLEYKKFRVSCTFEILGLIRRDLPHCVTSLFC